MEVTEYRKKFTSRKDQFRLYPIGDIHCGVIHCAESKIKRAVKQIAEDPFAIWIGMGDYADCIVPSDRRWDVEIIAEWVERSNIVESQRRWLVELFKPIADKCIGLLSGNHEESVRLRNYQDIHLDICRDLDVKPLGYSCFTKFLFERGKGNVHQFTGVFQHGSGAAQTEGGKIMRLKKFMDSFDADIYGMAHLHDIKTNVIAQLYVDSGGNIKQKVRVGAITGGWLRTYTEGLPPSYAEKKGYPPTVLGCPHYVITPDKQHLQVIGFSYV